MRLSPRVVALGLASKLSTLIHVIVLNAIPTETQHMILNTVYFYRALYSIAVLLSVNVIVPSSSLLLRQCPAVSFTQWSRYTIGISPYYLRDLLRTTCFIASLVVQYTIDDSSIRGVGKLTGIYSANYVAVRTVI